MVCLSEFKDDNELHLLPRCNHAFHLDDTDVLLFSHITWPIYCVNLVEQATIDNLDLLPGATSTIDPIGLQPETTALPLDHVTIIVDP